VQRAPLWKPSSRPLLFVTSSLHLHRQHFSIAAFHHSSLECCENSAPMLAYRHLFHAGGFTDVFKHALLAQLALALRSKVKPFFYLDTHAGTGRYNLTHPWAQKNKEYHAGIARIWTRSDTPPALAPYLAAVRAENPDGKLRRYPGSPLVVRSLMRAHDRMVVTELNQTDFAMLADLFARDRQVSVHLADGYAALNAFLPPRERRGLILIDSSFDRAREFDRLRRGVVLAHRKFATGVYALWYPLMDAPAMRAFERSFGATGIRKILQLELSVHDLAASSRLRGCGMLVVNPPFGFEHTARTILGWLHPVLAENGKGEQRVRWLVPE
jgi:23S rRNA (adenine2030-N6)-methyltransferase